MGKQSGMMHGDTGGGKSKHNQIDACCKNAVVGGNTSPNAGFGRKATVAVEKRSESNMLCVPDGSGKP